MAPIYLTIDSVRTGQNIESLMRFKGLCVKDVQEACGFEKPQAVYKWIHGASIPSIDNLLVLAKLFSTNVEGILAVEDALHPYIEGMIMKNKNYIQLECHWPFVLEYMFIDHCTYVADQIFRRNKLRVFFLHDYKKEDDDYCFVHCRITRKREKDFLRCMDELCNALLLTGHSDYMSYCDDVMERLSA